MDKKERAHTLWEQGKKSFHAGLNSYPYHYMSKFGQKTRMLKRRQLTRNEKKFQTALEKFDNSLAIYRELGDQQSEADLLTWMARVYKEIGKNAETLECLIKSTAIYDVLHTHPGEKASVKDVNNAMEFVLLFAEGRSHQRAGDYKSALEKFKAMLQLLRKTSERLYDEATILTLIGNANIALGNISEGEHYIKKVLAIYRELGKKGREAFLLYYMSSGYKTNGEYAKSLEHLDSAFTIFEQFNDINGMISAFTQKAQIYQKLGDNSKARASFEKALAISQNIDKKEEAFILNEIADLCYDLGDYKEALNTYNKSMQIFKKFNDIPNQGKALVGIGKANSHLGNYLVAIDNLEEALKVLEGIKYNSDHKADPLKAFANLHKRYACDALANVYTLLGDEKKAKGLRSIDIEGDYYLPKDDQLEILLHQGWDYAEEGKYSEALDCFHQAIDHCKEIDSKILEHSFFTAIGIIYRSLEKYQKALDFYKQSLELSRKYNHKAKELDALINIEKIYHYNLLDYQNALKYCEQALKITEEIGDRSNECVCLTAMGAIYTKNHEYKKATEYFDKALRVSNEMHAPEKIWIAQYHLGLLAARHTGEIKKAKSYLRDAINTIESIREKVIVEKYKIGFIENKLSVYTDLIYLLLESKENEEAFNYVERAKSRSLLDLLGNRLKLKEGKDKKLSQEEVRLQKKIKGILDKMQKEHSQPNEKQRKTLKVSNKELKKTRKQYARHLLKIKKENSELHSLVSVNPLTLKEVQELIDPDTTLLEYYTFKYEYEDPTLLYVIIWVVNKTKCEVVIRPLTTSLNKLTSYITAFREKITTLQPDYEKEAAELYDSLIGLAKPHIRTKRICIVPHSVLHYLPFHALINVPEISGIGATVNINEGILTVASTIEGASAYEAGLKTGDKITEIDGSSTANMSLQEAVSRLKGNPTTTVLLIIEEGESKTRKKVALERKIIAKSNDYSKFIVSDTKRKELKSPRFLIEEYDIFYAPSASVLKFVLEKRKEISGKVLAFGNPEFADKDLNLPYAEEEVKKIKESYPDTSIYMNEKATEKKAKQLSSDYSIIHFASHGELNPQSPLFSCIKMAKEKDEDGRLEVHEIFNLDLGNTSLVTLSACETGLGKLSKGDELIGLTRGFIYAGTPSIVASLWNVNDKSTSDLMSLFYKNLKTHSKVESLRMAQLEMINGEVGRGIVRGVGGITASKEGEDKPQSSTTVNGSHPFFWAPFILLGDWK